MSQVVNGSKHHVALARNLRLWPALWARRKKCLLCGCCTSFQFGVSLHLPLFHLFRRSLQVQQYISFYEVFQWAINVEVHVFRCLMKIKWQEWWYNALINVNSNSNKIHNEWYPYQVRVKNSTTYTFFRSSPRQGSPPPRRSSCSPKPSRKTILCGGRLPRTQKFRQYQNPRDHQSCCTPRHSRYCLLATNGPARASCPCYPTPMSRKRSCWWRARSGPYSLAR